MKKEATKEKTAGGNLLLPAVCKRRPDGKYEYRGYIIRNHGYYPPDQRVWWEAYNPETGQADFHAGTKREIKMLIDEDAARGANGR